jgi:hypothetical protein
MTTPVPTGALVPCDRPEHTVRRSQKDCAHHIGIEFDWMLRRARILVDDATALSLTANEYSALESIIVAQHAARRVPGNESETLA